MLNKMYCFCGCSDSEHAVRLLMFPQECVAVCCPSSPMADTPALMALKWTPCVSTPATPAIASMGSTRAPVCTGGRGAEDSRCAQVTQALPQFSKTIESWVDSLIFLERYSAEATVEMDWDLIKIHEKAF